MRLSRLHQLCIYLTFAVLFISGVAWMAAHYSSAPPADQFVPKSSSVEPLSMEIHGAAAMIFLIVFGSLIPRHMRGGWRARRNLRTGLSMLGFNLTLIVTGYLLYYAGVECVRDTASLVHMALGVLVLPLLVWHVTWRKRNAGKDI